MPSLKRGVAALACSLAAALAEPAAGQTLAIELDAANRDWVHRDQTIRLNLSRPPLASEGRLAILIGRTDLTDLFAVQGTSLEYRPDRLPLPPGETEVTVFLVSAQSWSELARFPLRVLTSGGFEQTDFAPRLDLQGMSVFDERLRPPGASSATGNDELTLNAHVGGGYRRNGWQFAGRMHTIGVSEQEKALRFAEKGVDAPSFDLADYALRFDHGADGRGFIELGHVAHTQHRYLVPGFSSRGTRFGVALGGAGSATFAAMNGTSIVGWRNLTGLNERDHRITTAGFGFELMPSRPGGLRIDLDYMNGSVLPQSGFNAGSIADRQASRAWGTRLAGATREGRLRFDAGYARSAFRNPFDPTLAQGGELVPVAKETRAAQYLDISWNAVQGRRLGGNRIANVALALRHERIDPQYATVAAFLQSDLHQNVAEISGTLGALQLLVSHARMEDNLDRIPSILKTKTRRSNASLGLALAELAPQRERLARWLPFATYSFDRTHQLGTGVPINSGFNESHVPDQLSERHAVGLDWRGGRWGIGYRADSVAQDNRQPGRELADFDHLVHSVSVTLTVHERLDVNFDLSRERSDAAETGRVDRTRTSGFGFAWRATDKLQLASTAGLTKAFDEARTNESESTFADLTLSYRVEWKNGRERGVSGQLFLRYSDVGFLSLDRIFAFDVDNRTRTVVGGFNVSIL